MGKDLIYVLHRSSDGTNEEGERERLVNFEKVGAEGNSFYLPKAYNYSLSRTDSALSTFCPYGKGVLLSTPPTLYGVNTPRLPSA